MKKYYFIATTLMALLSVQNNQVFAGGEIGLTAEARTKAIEDFLSIFSEEVREGLREGLNAKVPTFYWGHLDCHANLAQLPEGFWEKIKPIASTLKYFYLLGFDLGPSVDVSMFTNAVGLNLEYCNVRELKGLKNLNKLRSLCLKDNLLEKVPQDLESLSLTVLDFFACELKAFPESFGNAPIAQTLSTLDIEGNPITHFPSSMGNLKALQKLHISEEALIYSDFSFMKEGVLDVCKEGSPMPADKHQAVEDFVQLFDEAKQEGIRRVLLNSRELDTHYTAGGVVDQMPVGFWEKLAPFASELVSLNLNGMALGDTVDLSLFTGLTDELFLENCGLKQVVGLEKLTKLSCLYLRGNPLETMPEGLKDLNLVVLSLSGCGLKNFPEALVNSKIQNTLAFLDIKGNHFETLPSFESFKILRNLNIDPSHQYLQDQLADVVVTFDDLVSISDFLKEF